MRRSISLGIVAGVAASSSVLLHPAAAAPGARPIARDDRAVVLEDEVLRLPARGVLTNDTGTGPLRAELAAGPRRATLRLGARGAVRLRPGADVNGTVSFSYRAVDPAGRTDRALVRVEVVPVNDAPSFTGGPDQVVAAGSGPQAVAGWATRIDPGARDEREQQLAFVVDRVSAPALFATDGLPTVDPDGTLRYTPAPAERGTATVRLRLRDDGGVDHGGADTSAPVLLRITVSAARVAPTLRPGDGTTALDPGSSVPLVPIAEVADPDSEIASATVTVTGGSPAGLRLLGTPEPGITSRYDTETGRLVLTGPASDAAYQRALRSVLVAAEPSAEPGTRQVQIELEDVDGLVARAERELRVRARPAPNRPTLTSPDSAVVDEDTDATGNVLANDTDPDDVLTVASHTDPAHGTLTIGANGAFTYTPDTDWNGTEPTITYTTNTGATGTLDITVTPVNDNPVAHDDSYTTDEDTPVTRNVLDNDSDVDGDALTAALVTGPTNGTLVLNPTGTATYTPDADFYGTDAFTYEASDGSVSTSPVTVVVNVTPVNDAPVADDDSYTTAQGSLVAGNVLVNDTDVDGDPLIAFLVTGPTNGTLVLGPNGAATYTPSAGFHGTDEFTYEASDGRGGSDTATVRIRVDAPTVTAPDSAVVDEDSDATGNVLANDTDPDDVLTVASHTDPAHGTLTIGANGAFTYTPDTDWNGTEPAITYTTNTGATGTLDITVTPVNDAPVAHDDSYTIDEDTPLVLPFPLTALTANDTDVDGDALSVFAVGSPVNGTFAVSGSTLVFTPIPEFSGAASFTYNVHDGHGGTDSATVHVTVTSVNDAPSATDGAATSTGGLPANGSITASDPDGDTLSYSITAAPTGGTVVLNTATGSYTYTPTAAFAHAGSGTDTFTVTVSDGNGGTDTATVTVTVGRVNSPPTLVVSTGAPALDRSVLLTVTTGDADGDTVTVAAVAAHGTITPNPDGTLTYVPNPTFSGPEAITVVASDAYGGMTTNAVTITVPPL